MNCANFGWCFFVLKWIFADFYRFSRSRLLDGRGGGFGMGMIPAQGGVAVGRLGGVVKAAREADWVCLPRVWVIAGV